MWGEMYQRCRKAETISARMRRVAAIRRAAAVTVPAALITAGTVFAAPAAMASSHVFPTMNDGGGIYWRSGTNWNTPIRKSGYGVYPGTKISVSCYQKGTANVPGSSDAMWVKASWSSGPGTGSGWINEHFVNDGAPINKAAPGVPPCIPVKTTTAQRAANWAAAHVGQNYDSGLCLTFVFQAWSAAGVNLRNHVTVPINGNTYPVDIWKHFNTGKVGSGSQPPVGALVFYANKQGNRTLSHVAISVGGGRTVSTSDAVASKVHYETIAQHNYAIYLGWWLP